MHVERVMGIEPTLAAWEAAVLPLNYTRVVGSLGLARTDWQRATIPGMDITLNGESRTLPDDCRLIDLLQGEGLAERRVAVEINGAIVPRSAHATHPLRPDDRVEIVHALGGG